MHEQKLEVTKSSTHTPFSATTVARSTSALSKQQIVEGWPVDALHPKLMSDLWAGTPHLVFLKHKRCTLQIVAIAHYALCALFWVPFVTYDKEYSFMNLQESNDGILYLTLFETYEQKRPNLFSWNTLLCLESWRTKHDATCKTNLCKQRAHNASQGCVAEQPTILHVIVTHHIKVAYKRHNASQLRGALQNNIRF